ncbi:MAG: flagellar export chaperone FliS [Thermodesulfobacteriota bacterium]
MKSHARQYLRIMVESATPVENVVALCEKCLLHLEAVREGLAAGEVAAWRGALRKAMDILCYLEGSLDDGRPEQAELIGKGYRLILAKLGQVGAQQDLAALAQAEHWLAGMLSVWREAGHRLHGGDTDAAGAGGGEGEG